MPSSKLELVSSHGDQTLSRTRFVLHGTDGATETISERDAGMLVIEGKAAVTTNLLNAKAWTQSGLHEAHGPMIGNGAIGEAGTVMVYALPPDLNLGYAIFTTAYIDRKLMRVNGAPLRYAGSRSELAFYTAQDAEGQRIHLESEVANGYSIEQHPRLAIKTKYLIGEFAPGVAFDSVTNKLDITVRSMQSVDFNSIESDLTSIFKPSTLANAVLVPPMIRDILVGTIESIVLSRVRLMRWQGLQLLGYYFFEGTKTAHIPPVKDVGEQKRRLDELGRQLASSPIFSGELAWLTTYVAHEMELMRVELEAADLESMTD
jgi:hypothetical protein